MQFGRELRARSTGTDNGHMQLARLHRRILLLGAQACVHQALVETARLLGGFQRHGVLGRTRRAEIVGDTAHRHDQRVVLHGGLRRDFAALVVRGRRQRNHARLPVQADHFAKAIAEAMPVCLRDVVQLVLATAQAAGCNCVQQRLPDMGTTAVNQRNPRTVPAAKFVTQARGQLQPRGTTADDHHMMQTFIGVHDYPRSVRGECE